jgi:hypothetical protein
MKNPAHEHEAHPYSSVEECLSDIITKFAAAEEWHDTAKKCAVHNDHWGVARFHEAMEKKAFHNNLCLGKAVAEKPFSISTSIDYEAVQKAPGTAHYTEDKTVWHFDMWLNMLGEHRKCFTDAAYYLSECKEITLYRMICDYICDIENEMQYVGRVKRRITPTNLNHPDAYRVFCELHKYFEHEWCIDKRIDFDI